MLKKREKILNKIICTKENIFTLLKDFYDPSIWRFICVNAQNTQNGFEVGYFFSKYGAFDEVSVFVFEISKDDQIGSIASFIPSAIMSEREIVDLFGIKIGEVEGGLYLDEDSQKTPLRRD